jgi:hypothetical protein
MSPLFQAETREAYFSPCRKYRYSLKIIWNSTLPLLVVIGLNPSTADEYKDDPTVAKCKRLARKLGCGGLIMLNLFAFKSTDPSDMFAADDPVGQENDKVLLELTQNAFIVLVAWGNGGLYRNRASDVVVNILKDRKLKCLNINKTGMPEHPLYCKTGELTDYGMAKR